MVFYFAALLLLLLESGLILDVTIRDFLPGLKEKCCGDGDMATGTGLEHWKRLAINLHTSTFVYWSLIMNLGQ